MLSCRMDVVRKLLVCSGETCVKALMVSMKRLDMVRFVVGCWGLESVELKSFVRFGLKLASNSWMPL